MSIMTSLYKMGQLKYTPSRPIAIEFSTLRKSALCIVLLHLHHALHQRITASLNPEQVLPRL